MERRRMQKRYHAIALTTILALVISLSYLCAIAKAADPGPDPTIDPGTIPPWYNMNIEVWTDPAQPTKDQINWVRAKVTNAGTSPASNVKVQFFFGSGLVGAMSAMGPGWENIGTSDDITPAIPAHGWAYCSWVEWTPSTSGHHCLKAVVTTLVGGDDYAGNNTVQRNIEVRNAPAGGSMTIRFQVWAPTFNEPWTNIGLNLEHDWPNGTVWHWLPHGPPYDIPINGSVQLELNVELPKNASIRVYTATVTALFENGTAYGGFGIETHVEAVVGGTWVPVDKINLIAPYIGLTTAILGITIASAAYVKRFKRKKE
jgi:hypothetical protein